ncbi:ATP-binding protein, partial [Listeria booriae]|uniref:ATP-binding protein n=1 Tax=Listeria booriae TaxID=1552123 RepID=UPI00162935B0
YYEDEEKKIINPLLTTFEQRRFDRILLTLRSITQNYGDIFNQHTSIPPLDDVHYCVFNMEGLLKQSQNIFNAQFFNMLNMVWDQAIRRGQLEKYRYDRKQTSFWDIVYSLIIIDEFHNITKMNNAIAMMLLDRLAREGRKYFLGIGLATQNFYDVLPQQITTDVEKYMKNLFNITTYIFIMNQDPESVSAID